MNPPPPMLPALGWVTASAKAVATAASTADPPLASTAAPASQAGAGVETTSPPFEGTPSSGAAITPRRAGIASSSAIRGSARRRTCVIPAAYPERWLAPLRQRCQPPFGGGVLFAQLGSRDADLARRTLSARRHLRRARHQRLRLLRSRHA